MAATRSLQRSFSGGELSAEMFARLDDAKYQQGLALCRNFIPRAQGPAQNRPGLAFVREVKYSARRVRLLPFTYSTTQTMVLELGEGYFRFHTRGATLMQGGAPYEVANPYAEADLADIHYVQSADVLTLVHPGYPPMELRRLGELDWRLNVLSFAPPVASPGAPVLSASGFTTAKYTYHYALTAIAADGVGESALGPIAQIDANLLETGCTVGIAWSPVPGALRYNVYKLGGGVFGFIGTTGATQLIDDNIAPDLSKTEPLYQSVFDGALNYPGAVSYFEQRRCFAGTRAAPQNIWMTKSGTESNMSYSLPVRDDDRIAFRVAAREANTIRHIVPLDQLLLLTSSAEWRVTSVNSDAVTPTTISVRPQSYVGASNVQPVVVNNSCLYGAARGGHLREMGYNWQANGFVSGDLSLRAAHLFDGLNLLDLAYAKAPQPIVWAVSSSGKLLGLTYVPEQQVGAWHQHDTDGAFESCAVVSEGDEDVLYVVVRRQVQGQTRRYIERMAERRFDTLADAFFVDSGKTYTGPPVRQLTGLAHLEGKTVSILADGCVQAPQVVAGGSVHLDEAASKVSVGLPIVADLQTLPLAAQVDAAFGQGRAKNINKVWLRVLRASGIKAGPNADELVEHKQRSTEAPGEPPALASDEIALVLSPTWSQSGQVLLRHDEPVPLTVVSLTAEVALGG